MDATILLVTAVTVIGRSLTFGLSIGLSWFAADNIGTVFMLLANRLTHNDFWLNVTGYFLGPILNNLPTTFLSSKVLTIGPPPLVQVDRTQSLLVILAYTLIFAIVALVLTWRRDVKE